MGVLSPAFAQDTPAYDTMSLEDLHQAMMADPENLDVNYAYAYRAMAEGNADGAQAAFERMLMINPALDRVKLDLALVYIGKGNLTDAETLFQEVLVSNPPMAVRQRIEELRGQIRRKRSRSVFTGTWLFGFNYDSNANAAPSTGQVSIFGVNVPLDDTSKSQRDGHFYTGVAVNHKLGLGNQDGDSWGTDLLAYKTAQNSLETLNLTTTSVSTGPQINFPEKKASVAVKVSATETNLGGRPYLKTVGASVQATRKIAERITLLATISTEKRMFSNSDLNPSAAERTGMTHGQELALQVQLTNNDQVVLSVNNRSENTRFAYNDNAQQELAVTHTHLFSDKLQGWFMSNRFSVKNTDYKGPNALISNSVRRDDEKSWQVVFGRNLTDDLTWTLSYQYRNVDSNIQNYQYDNHRFSTGLAMRF